MAEASAWWREHRPDSRIDLDEELAKALDTIRDWPSLGERARSEELGDARRLFVGSVGYFVYYRVQPSVIAILLLRHTRRRPI